MNKLSSERFKGIKVYINVDMAGTKNPEVVIAETFKSSVTDMEKMLKKHGRAESEYKLFLDGVRAIPAHAGDLA